MQPKCTWFLCNRDAIGWFRNGRVGFALCKEHGGYADVAELWDALKRSGMVERVCVCGRPFLSRDENPLCPPCRDRLDPEFVARELGADEHGPKQ